MKIERLSENQIRCTLSRTDLRERRISLFELAYGGEKARHLFREMLTLENPYRCPHGRPTVIRWSRAEIEKLFRRIV